MKSFKAFLEDVNPDGSTSLRAGEDYGSSTFQKRLRDDKEKKEKDKEKKREENANTARSEFRHGAGMVSYEKHPETGKVVKGRRKNGVFTPDEDG